VRYASVLLVDGLLDDPLGIILTVRRQRICPHFFTVLLHDTIPILADGCEISCGVNLEAHVVVLKSCAHDDVGYSGFDSHHKLH